MKKMSFESGVEVRSVHRIWSLSGSRFDPEPDEFQTFVDTSLSKGTSMMKFLRRSDRFFHKRGPNSYKLPYFAVLKNLTRNSRTDTLCFK